MQVKIILFLRFSKESEIDLPILIVSINVMPMIPAAHDMIISPPVSGIRGANYHIMCRGNHRHDIYRDDEDRQVYLTLLRETKKEHNFHLCSGKVSHPVNFSRGQTPKQLGNYSDNCTPCCIRDEGRPLGTAMQVEVSNHLKLLWTKAMVVSVKEKARQDLGR